MAWRTLIEDVPSARLPVVWIRRMTVVALVASSLLAGGCSGGGGAGGGGASGGSSSPSASPVATTWPLTGLPGYPTDSQEQVVTVKIENTAAGRPQRGIGSADLVIQELVEGGLTRLAAMFHSKYPDVAGPVRSMRESDIGLVLPTGGTLAASGAAPSTISALRDAGVPTVVEGGTGFYRDPTRRSPYNLMLDVAKLADSLPAGRPPGSYLQFGDVPADAEGSSAQRIRLTWPAASSSFKYDAKSGLWTRTDLTDPSDFSFQNVIALKLKVEYSGGRDVAGTPIPTMVTQGSGSGVVVTGGKAYDVRWSKAAPDAPWSLTYIPAAAKGETPQAQPFPVPPGRTWLALLPKSGGSVKVTPAATASSSE